MPQLAFRPTLPGRCNDCGGKIRYAGEICYTCSPQAWIARQQRIVSSARLGRTNAVAAADALDPLQALTRNAANGALAHEARVMRSYRPYVSRRNQAAQDDSALLARARRERAEAAPVIARAQAASRAASRTAYSAQEITYGGQEITRSSGGCRHCAQMNVTPREAAYIHRRAR